MSSLPKPIERVCYMCGQKAFYVCPKCNSIYYCPECLNYELSAHSKCILCKKKLRIKSLEDCYRECQYHQDYHPVLYDIYYHQL